MNYNPFEASSIVWPLVFLLLALLVLKQVRDEIRPIFRNIVGGLAVKAQSNAIAWAIVLLIATLGSMNALQEVAGENNWPFVKAFAKILTPFIAGLVAGARTSPLTNSAPTVTVEKDKTLP